MQVRLQEQKMSVYPVCMWSASTQRQPYFCDVLLCQCTFTSIILWI